MYLSKATATAVLSRRTTVCGPSVFAWVKAIAAARAALPSPASVCGVVVFTWVRVHQLQCDPVLPVYVNF